MITTVKEHCFNVICYILDRWMVDELHPHRWPTSLSKKKHHTSGNPLGYLKISKMAISLFTVRKDEAVKEI